MGKDTHNRIELRQQYPIDPSFSLRPTNTRPTEIFQRSVKFRQLVDCFVAHERFADEYDLVGVVHSNELRAQVSESQANKRRSRASEHCSGRTLAKARMSGSLSCIRPAVSIKTTSNRFALAEWNRRVSSTVQRRISCNKFRLRLSEE